jgi:hypothetical protein
MIPNPIELTSIVASTNLIAGEREVRLMSVRGLCCGHQQTVTKYLWGCKRRPAPQVEMPRPKTATLSRGSKQEAPARLHVAASLPPELSLDACVGWNDAELY